METNDGEHWLNILKFSTVNKYPILKTAKIKILKNKKQKKSQEASMLKSLAMIWRYLAQIMTFTHGVHRGICGTCLMESCEQTVGCIMSSDTCLFVCGPSPLLGHWSWEIQHCLPFCPGSLWPQHKSHNRVSPQRWWVTVYVVTLKNISV